MMLTSNIRVGFGQDIHALVPNRKCQIGGVDIPFEMGLHGHSDADVLLHAVMDALLGAAALGDIGMLFPDTDEAYRGISSVVLLSRVKRLVAEAGFGIVNLDTLILCERPKIAPYREAIRSSMGKVLGIDTNRISVKAGTNEGFDAIGKGLAVECKALVLLEFLGVE